MSAALIQHMTYLRETIFSEYVQQSGFPTPTVSNNHYFTFDVRIWIHPNCCQFSTSWTVRFGLITWGERMKKSRSCSVQNWSAGEEEYRLRLVESYLKQSTNGNRFTECSVGLFHTWTVLWELLVQNDLQHGLLFPEKEAGLPSSMSSRGFLQYLSIVPEVAVSGPLQFQDHISNN